MKSQFYTTYKYRLERMSLEDIVKSQDWNKQMYDRMTHESAKKCFGERIVLALLELKRRQVQCGG